MSRLAIIAAPSPDHVPLWFVDGERATRKQAAEVLRQEGLDLFWFYEKHALRVSEEDWEEYERLFPLPD